MKIEITPDELIAMLKYFKNPYTSNGDNTKKEVLTPASVHAVWTMPSNISTTASETTSLKG